MNTLPSEILQHICTFLPPTSLVSSLSHISKQFRELIVEDSSLWIQLCKGKHKHTLDLVRAETLPIHWDWKKYYFYAPVTDNLIINGRAEDDFDQWTEVEGEWEVEEVDGPEDEKLDGKINAWVASYQWCAKLQVVDLEMRRVYVNEIKMYNSVEVVEYCRPRSDCGCMYMMDARLYNSKKEILAQHHFSKTFAQWSSEKWEKFSHVFEVPPGLKYIVIEHKGKDTQFWAGYYGPKISCTRVRFFDIRNQAPPTDEDLLWDWGMEDDRYKCEDTPPTPRKVYYFPWETLELTESYIDDNFDELDAFYSEEEEGEEEFDGEDEDGEVESDEGEVFEDSDGNEVHLG